MIVAAKDVHKTYHEMEKPVQALRGLSLEVNAGDYIAVAGPSGCGKSTFLHMLGALDVPTSGEIFWENESTNKWDESRRTRLR
ncbi:ATP-binding cassette domain-containing protein, partial [bacterium]|nr:ATP-binding cassette domain-containing protein [bacterium]